MTPVRNFHKIIFKERYVRIYITQVGIYITKVDIYSTQVGIYSTQVGIYITQVDIYSTQVGIYSTQVGRQVRTSSHCETFITAESLTFYIKAIFKFNLFDFQKSFIRQLFYTLKCPSQYQGRQVGGWVGTMQQFYVRN